MIGSDILAHRPDWTVVPNPFSAEGEDPIVLLPALRPDFAAFHAVPWRTRRAMSGSAGGGNARPSRMPRRACLVTVERVVEGDFLQDERLAPGAISATYMTRWRWRSAARTRWRCSTNTAADAAYVAEYARMAQTAEGFRAWLEREVLRPPTGRLARGR